MNLTTTQNRDYHSDIAAQSAIGFGSPFYQVDTPPLEWFFCVLSMASPVMGGPCGSPSGLPVPDTGLPICMVPLTLLVEGKRKIKPLIRSHSMTITISAQIRPLIGLCDNPDITDLPFIADSGKGKNKQRNFWNVKPNGNYGDECLIGKSYALEYLQYAIITGPAPISWIIQEMPKELTGIEVGFLTTLHEFATIGAASQARALA